MRRRPQKSSSAGRRKENTYSHDMHRPGSEVTQRSPGLFVPTESRKSATGKSPRPDHRRALAQPSRGAWGLCSKVFRLALRSLNTSCSEIGPFYTLGVQFTGGPP